MTRRRLDAELVRRGLASSRDAARAAVAAGRVTVGGAPALKPDRLVADAEPLLVSGDPARFVSRGGEKLDAALARFGVAVAGRACLDAGASTGGFTDCLLQRGAGRVTAVDVGHGQLHERIRADQRVDVRERTNIRAATPESLGGRFEVVVADLSFISLVTVLDALVACGADGADLVALVKPQFEAGRREASRGRGVVRDPAVWRRVVGEVDAALAARGAQPRGWMVSPLRGADGNVEFLVHARLGHAGPVDGSDPGALDALVASVGP